MRVTSEVWVAALMRRVFAGGGFAAVDRRGAREAGAIFLRVRRRDGTFELLGPAPQAIYEQTRPQERLFASLCQSDDEEPISRRLVSEARFDPDLWIVELEPADRLPEELVRLMKP